MAIKKSLTPPEPYTPQSNKGAHQSVSIDCVEGINSLINASTANINELRRDAKMAYDSVSDDPELSQTAMRWFGVRVKIQQLDNDRLDTILKHVTKSMSNGSPKTDSSAVQNFDMYTMEKLHDVLNQRHVDESDEMVGE